VFVDVLRFLVDMTSNTELTERLVSHKIVFDAGCGFVGIQIKHRH